MKRIFSLILALSFLFATPAFANPLYSAGTTIFSDNFNRTDSNTVGNGWDEIEVNDPPDDADGVILSNQLVFNSAGNNAAVALRQGTNFTNIMVSFKFTTGTATNVDGFSLRHTDTATADRGFGVGERIVFNGSADTVSIADVGGTQASASFDFVALTQYNIEWVIDANNYMEVRVWPTGSTRPYAPTLRASFTPDTTNSYWAFGDRFDARYDDFVVSNLVTTDIGTNLRAGKMLLRGGKLIIN